MALYYSMHSEHHIKQKILMKKYNAVNQTLTY